MASVFKEYLVGSPGLHAEETVIISIVDGKLCITPEREGRKQVVVEDSVAVTVYTSGETVRFEIEDSL